MNTYIMNTFDKYIENNTGNLIPDNMTYIVTGKDISKEQAEDIIFRTNSSSRHMDMIKNYIDEDISGYDSYDNFSFREHILNYIQVIDLETLKNDWIESHYIMGVNGFCRPDGTIGCVYKHSDPASLLDLTEDLELLGDKFPYLDLEVFVFNKEKGNDDITLKVTLKNGKVEINKHRFLKDEESLLIKTIDEDRNFSKKYGNKNIYFNDIRKHIFLHDRYGLSNETYQKYFKMLKEAVNSYKKPNYNL